MKKDLDFSITDPTTGQRTPVRLAQDKELSNCWKKDLDFGLIDPATGQRTAIALPPEDGRERTLIEKIDALGWYVEESRSLRPFQAPPDGRWLLGVGLALGAAVGYLAGTTAAPPQGGGSGCACEPPTVSEAARIMRAHRRS